MVIACSLVQQSWKLSHIWSDPRSRNLLPRQICWRQLYRQTIWSVPPIKSSSNFKFKQNMPAFYVFQTIPVANEFYTYMFHTKMAIKISLASSKHESHGNFVAFELMLYLVGLVSDRWASMGAVLPRNCGATNGTNRQKIWRFDTTYQIAS